MGMLRQLVGLFIILGNFFASLFASLFGTEASKPVKILLLGLAGSGKTSILHYLKCGTVVSETVPTIGCNMEQLSAGAVKFEAWDLGGQDTLRSYWSYFYEHTQAIIFVVDSADREHIPQAGDVLRQLCNTPELSNAVVAIFSNKQDLRESLSPVEVSQALGLTEIKNRPWSIFKTSAVTGEGLQDGITWVATTLQQQQTQR